MTAFHLNGIPSRVSDPSRLEGWWLSRVLPTGTLLSAVGATDLLTESRAPGRSGQSRKRATLRRLPDSSPSKPFRGGPRQPHGWARHHRHQYRR